MKKIILFLSAAAFFAACGESKKTAEATQDVAQAGTEAVTYTVNPAESRVLWSGAKKLEGAHNGTVALTEGNLSFEGENLIAGNFVINMNTIVDQSITEDQGQSKLIGHLKSADFFMVDSFPTAKFEITKVEKLDNASEGTHLVSGNLTIKGQTHGITFPAHVTSTETGITAHAKFEINRNEWGIVWGGSKETNAGVLDFLKENLLKDMIGFEVNLVASK